MGTYAKAIVASLGAAVTAMLGLIQESTQLWTVLTILAAALTAAAVYMVPNSPYIHTPGPGPDVPPL